MNDYIAELEVYKALADEAYPLLLAMAECIGNLPSSDVDGRAYAAWDATTINAPDKVGWLARHEALKLGRYLHPDNAAYFDWAARIEWLEAYVKQGGCPGLINDDNGHWAVSDTGMQDMPDEDEPRGVSTVSFFVEAGEWRNSVREAIDAFIVATERKER